MASDVLGAQPHDLHFREPDLDLTMACEVSHAYNTPDDWAALSHGSQPRFTAANYMPFAAATAEGQFASSLTDGRESKNNAESRDKALRPCAGFGAGTAINASGPTIYDVPAGYTSSMITATNALPPNQNVTTVSPIQIRFGQDEVSPTFDDGFALGAPPPGSEQAKFLHSSAYPNQAPFKLRSDSVQTTLDGSIPTTKSNVGRRRKSESVETDSARAVYLEKNRKAASKCRNKQKRQQEDLVETAREVERRNRVLRAEVEILRGGMRELMELVGQHSDCPDNRLKLYVQREADRLANGVVPATYLSPALQTMFPCPTLPPEMISPPDPQRDGDGL